MASTTDILLKKIAGLWKEAEKLQRQWMTQSKTKPAKRKKAKAKSKAKRRR